MRGAPNAPGQGRRGSSTLSLHSRHPAHGRHPIMSRVTLRPPRAGASANLTAATRVSYVTSQHNVIESVFEAFELNHTHKYYQVCSFKENPAH